MNKDQLAIVEEWHGVVPPEMARRYWELADKRTELPGFVNRRAAAILAELERIAERPSVKWRR